MSPQPGTCEIWLASLAALTPRLPALRTLLTAQERARADRYRRAPDRARATASAALLRVLLGRYLACEPGALVLDRECPRCGRPHGRPRFRGDAEPWFSVSHSGDLLVLAFTARPQVGVDVEAVASASTSADDALASLALTPDERRQLRAMPPTGRRRALLEYWTGKEAALKGLSVGLSVTLGGARLDGAGRDRTAVVSRPGHPVSRLAVTPLDLGKDYVGALATSEPVPDLRLRRLPADTVP